MRLTDANLIFAGSEPKFTSELSVLDLIKSLTWYNQNKQTKDSEKYAIDYFKKKLKLDASSALKNRSSTFGFVCRIVSNGGILNTKDQEWFDNEINQVKAELKVKPKVVVIDASAPVVNVVSIQERIRDKANECIADLEGQVDDILTSQFKTIGSPYGVMHTLNIKDAQTKYIIEWAKQKRNEFDDVMNTDDAELKEGYSNFSKIQLKKMVGYFDQVILDCAKITQSSVQNRKPRKRKTKSPEELVAKIKICKEFAELKLQSIAPKDIIGVMQLWVYNTKTRKLGVYHAEDAGGLTVKGSSLLNYNESKSVQKKLRKPEEMLPLILTGGKVFLKNALVGIRAVESPLSGRVNEDTVLLRVSK
jgi:hypothetical protein